MECLLEKGVHVNTQDDGGLIPLHNACSFGHAEVVSSLLQHGADANSRDKWGYTPLHEASNKGKVCTVKQLTTRVNWCKLVVPLLYNIELIIG